MTINGNSSIDTPFELLLSVLFVFVIMIILCKLGAMLDKLPAPGAKSKSKSKEVVKEVKKEVKKDIKKEVVKDIKESTSDKDKSVSIEKDSSTVTNSSSSTASNNMSSTTSSCGGAGYICPYSNVAVQNNANVYPNNDNYLHDRFVVSPTKDDYVESKKISESFLSDTELGNIRNRNVNIHVNDVDYNLSSKQSLHKRISEMTNHNQQTRERLLDEFEGLSREMKLLIIENIIQKM